MGFRFQSRRSDGWAQGGAAPQKPINPEQRFGVISGFLGGDTDYRHHGVRTDSASTPPPGAGRAAVSAPVAFSATRALLLYRYLPVDVRFALQRQLQIMMASTEFYGCNGLEVTETMRLLTLAQAALLYRNISQDQLASFPTVLLYPDAFVREGELTDELGLVSRQRHIMLGESWQHGRVIVSWSDIEQDLRRLDGHNLVIHEYAHQIDGYDGSMNGVPMLPNETQYRRWTRVMTAAFEDVNHQVQWGE